MKDTFVNAHIKPVVSGLITYLKPKLINYLDSHLSKNLSFFSVENKKWDAAKKQKYYLNII